MRDELARTIRINIPPQRGGSDAGARAGRRGGRARTPRGGAAAEPAVARASVSELLRSVYDAVLIADLRGVVVDCNERALEFFRYERDRLLGLNVVEIISGAEHTLLARLEENLRKHRYSVVEAYCLRSDGSRFASEIAVGRLQVGNEERRSFFVRDISIRKKAQEELERAIARLEEHDRAKSHFIANVSHELRTPLTSMIYAIANMLKGVTGTLSDGVRGYLEMLERECRRLLDTVNDILDIEKVETGTLTLAKVRLPLVRIVDRALRPLRVQALAKNLEMTADFGDGRWFVACDPNKIERVVTNIVGNAIKFSADGGCLDLSVLSDPADPGAVLVRVLDTGVGIPREALPRVQERFFRVGDQISGSGLGLSIANEILTRHGGGLEIQSPAPGRDKGTLATIRLPVAPPPVVLAVDDEPNVLILLERQLEAQGYRVKKARSGRGALDLIEREKPDVVILDLVMVGMDGCDLVITLKGKQEWRDLPIVVLTGAALSRDKAEILRSYAVPVLAKPWKGVEILDHIESAFVGSAAFAARQHKDKGNADGPRQDRDAATGR